MSNKGIDDYENEDWWAEPKTLVDISTLLPRRVVYARYCAVTEGDSTSPHKHRSIEQASACPYHHDRKTVVREYDERMGGEYILTSRDSV